ncbi:MAG: glycoside hydrolase family 13 protein [Flammeovirgaceae bacterium]
MIRSFLLLFLCLFATVSFAQIDIAKVEPPNWWVGMKNRQVQLIVHGDGIGAATVSAKYKKVKIVKVDKATSPNYLFVTLDIHPKAKAGKVPLTFTKDGKSYTHEYELKARSTDKNRILGFDNSDLIYLLMPDRFANGDPSNDNIEGMEQMNREETLGRHGGDIKGIVDHLDYIKDLGATAIWHNPILENDMEAHSYHGYAITDLYKVDARFGSNEDYVALVDKAQEKGLKIIMDMVFNHIGLNHWTLKDLPFENWIHQHKEFTRSNFRATTIIDPYVSEYDKKKMLTGWFDTTMPDLDQRNPFVAKYLIQNSIWWIEYAGLDGIRMDTYPYPYKEFMAEWAKAVMMEYPQFNIVGESWVQEVGIEAYWQKQAGLAGYESNLPSVTDFIVYQGISNAFNEDEGWSTGMARLYYVLAQDFLYPDANGLVTFADNHDVNRLYTQLGKDFNKFKMAMGFLLTTRGIPQVYYGTEILMFGDASDHGLLRKDFPGGWAGDKENKFTKAGRTAQENECFDFIRSLMRYRRDNKVMQTGKLTQFIPEDGVYVYFRTNAEKTVMVIMNNKNDQEKKVDTARFAECIKDFTKGKRITTGKTITNLKTITMPAKSIQVLELMK